jgi:Uma2 family endonuclease
LLAASSGVIINAMTTHLAKPRKKAASRRGANGHRNGARLGDIIINGSLHIPRWVVDHDSYRRWAFSDGFPTQGQFAFLDGEIWVDLSMETDFHNQIKSVITIVIGYLVLQERLGRFYVDGMLLTNPTVGLSTEPDAMFISNQRFAKGDAKLKSGRKSMEVSGSADMTLEVISKTSAVKDTVDLMDLYAKAGVREYWLVDSTLDSPELVIMRLVAEKYVAVRKREGWVKSRVFSRSFRLTSRTDADGLLQFELETK